eukprot:gene6833-13841_t
MFSNIGLKCLSFQTFLEKVLLPLRCVYRIHVPTSTAWNDF